MDRNDRRLERWLAAGVIDAETAERIRAFERAREGGVGRALPVALALGFGGVLVAAGVLLFVAANWDVMSPALRVTAVLTMVGAFHVGGAAAAGRFEALATTLHALGTIALGAGIFLAGQVFNLDEHWPSGLMLWAIGAWAGWWLRRDWAQLALAVSLTPAWLGAEWSALRLAEAWRVLAPEVGFFLLALAYVSVDRGRFARAVERTFFWLGAVSLPVTAVILAGAAATRVEFEAARLARPAFGALPFGVPATPDIVALGWTVALLAPFAAAWLLRRQGTSMNAAATVWAVALVNVHLLHSRLWMYPWLAVGCVGLALWGLRERRAPLVNFAAAGFALTVMAFYFETVMTKMGRSVSLMGLGALFLVGGYLLERARRRMVGAMKGGLA